MRRSALAVGLAECWPAPGRSGLRAKWEVVLGKAETEDRG